MYGAKEVLYGALHIVKVPPKYATLKSPRGFLTTVASLALAEVNTGLLA